MGFVFKSSTNLDEKRNLLISAVSYLNEHKNKDADSLFKEQDAYESIYCIGFMLAFNLKNIDLDLFTNENIEIVFGKFLMYFYEKRNQYDFETDKIEFASAPKKDLNFKQKCVEFFSTILYSINIIAAKHMVSIKIKAV
jgi:hypothetical protein